MPKQQELKGVFVNKPDVGYMWETLLNLLAQQEGWDCEFKVKATLKDEYREGAEASDQTRSVV